FGAAAEGELAARFDAVRAAAARAARAGDPHALRLLERLDRIAFDPRRTDGAALARSLVDTALGQRLALLATAALGGADDAAAARESVAARLLVALGIDGGTPEAARLRDVALAALDSLVARDRAGLALSSAGPRLRALRAELVRSVLAQLGTSANARLGSLADPSRSHAPLDGALARVLLTHGRGGAAAALLDSVASLATGGAAEGGAALVVESGRVTGDTALRSALGSWVATGELEHAWNVARRELGDPTGFAFVVPDGPDGHTTVRATASEEEDSARVRDGDDAPFRVTVGVDFSGLGPVRADLVVREGRIAARIVASDPRTAMAIRRRSDELEARLGLEGRDVLLAVAEGQVDDVRVDPHRAVGADDDRHMMDLEG
ncbi:MAG: hypothetical protein AAGA20_23220, partial [Planctomycetota bacterium]